MIPAKQTTGLGPWRGYYSNFTVIVYLGVLSVTAVFRRAVFTGLTPGEVARLTAEEIVGDLLGVW